jgi:hypothetical protein
MIPIVLNGKRMRKPIKGGFKKDWIFWRLLEPPRVLHKTQQQQQQQLAPLHPNFNLHNQPTFERLVEFSSFTRQAAISEVLDTSTVFGTSAPQSSDGDPQSILLLPVFEKTGDSSSTIVGHVIAVIPWGLFFQNVLQDGHDGVFLVLSESCTSGQSFTYRVDGSKATFLGIGDMHNVALDEYHQSTEFVAYDGDLDGISGGILSDHCEYTLHVYPSQTYQTAFQTKSPIIFCSSVVIIFVFAGMVFFLYNWFVERRQTKVHTVAVTSNAIVSSLFPKQVRDKMHANAAQAATATAQKQQQDAKVEKAKHNPFKRANAQTLLQQQAGILLLQQQQQQQPHPSGGIDDSSAPIAELFPSATVFFADIAGFTSWSSTREPAHVFLLLETVYAAFDALAKKRRIFKIETIGDCYLAVCGLPEPNTQHAGGT